MDKKIKLYVLTGFLGSGKTTMLQNLLKRKAGIKVGVIQNEFGKVSVDGEILSNNDISMTRLSNGSIFCTCQKLNFVQALADMSGQNLDEMYVESSGLGDPSNLMEILDAAAVLMGEQRYEISGVICLIDAVSFLEEASQMEALAAQVVHSNLAVINKTDLVSDERLTEVKEEILKFNPDILVTETTFGQIDDQYLNIDLREYHWAASEEAKVNEKNRPKTFSMTYEQSVPKEKFEAFLREILPECYRIKGFALLDGNWYQVDVVTDRIDYKLCQPKEESCMVMISRVSIQLLRTMDAAWKTLVGLPVKFRN